MIKPYIFYFHESDSYSPLSAVKYNHDNQTGEYKHKVTPFVAYSDYQKLRETLDDIALKCTRYVHPTEFDDFLQEILERAKR